MLRIFRRRLHVFLSTFHIILSSPLSLSSSLVFILLSLILSLVLFSVPLPYTSGVRSLFNSIKVLLVNLFGSNLQLISPENPKRTTCMWRVLYLVYVIVEKNPSVISFFIEEVLSFCDSLFKKYNEFFANPTAFRMLFVQEQEPIKSYFQFNYHQ